ncbi:hypothetical protein N7465_002212 [Penicillium sp. CMV-2018d]|nr:hypothetical protein N7465_002212 [Penicillium sp. CMV-2018d]
MIPGDCLFFFFFFFRLSHLQFLQNLLRHSTIGEIYNAVEANEDQVFDTYQGPSNHLRTSKTMGDRPIPTLSGAQFELLSHLRGHAEPRARVRAFILIEAECIMNIVPIIIQQTYFDGCVRDSQLWALEARMQVLLDEMTHLQEEDKIDHTIPYDMWRSC